MSPCTKPIIGTHRPLCGVESCDNPMHRVSNIEGLIPHYTVHLIEEDKSKNTIRSYLADIKTFVKWIGNIPPIKIKALDIADYRDELFTAGKSPATIRRALVTLQRLFDWAIKQGAMLENPAVNIKPIQQEPLAPRSLAVEEQETLMMTVQRIGTDRDKALIALMINTGLRVSEVTALRTEDVSDTVTVRHGKGGKQRIVPLNKPARRAMRTYLANHEDEMLFLSMKGKPLSDRGVRYILDKYTDAAKMDRISPHILRHTCATNMRLAGQPLERIQAILGHTNINTTARYTIPSENDLRAAVESVA
ncbi:integrase [Candidatus Poribacteria bacterium]|nr:MAG: integrase [Candidatus Poribacteria bacterium]